MAARKLSCDFRTGFFFNQHSVSHLSKVKVRGVILQINKMLSSLGNGSDKFGSSVSSRI